MNVLDWGISLIIFLQGLGDWLIPIMEGITFLGDEEFYLLLAPIVYWCLDSTTGVRMGLILMVSGCLNHIVKLAFHAPRPYWISTSVQAFDSETSFGIPSGHAQNSVAVWGSLAYWQRKPWAWIGAIALMFLIGISRLFVGVHFPTDTLLGWGIGLVVLWGYLRIEPHAQTWLWKRSLKEQVLLALGASLLTILVSFLVRFALGDWQVPSQWIQTAAAALPDAEPIAPLAQSGIVSNAAAFFGLAAGALWMRHRGGFSTRGPSWQLAARYFLGVAGVLLVWRGLAMIFPGGENFVGYLFRYIRYTLIGIWVTGVAPWLFIRFKLAKTLQSV